MMSFPFLDEAFNCANYHIVFFYVLHSVQTFWNQGCRSFIPLCVHCDEEILGSTQQKVLFSVVLCGVKDDEVFYSI